MTFQDRSGPLSQREIEHMIDRATVSWGDQYNQTLLLTVRAVLRLHVAMDGKFTRKDQTEI